MPLFLLSVEVLIFSNDECFPREDRRTRTNDNEFILPFN